MVTNGQIGMIVFSMVMGLIIPLVLVILCKKKYHTSMKIFWIGCGVWFVFTQVLEVIMHQCILGSSVGPTIRENIVLYGIYGGLAAGVFEEVGRFLAMKYVCKNQHNDSYNALMYGVGHGGFEAAYILTVGGINNLIYASIINANKTDVILSALPEESQAQIQQLFDQLITTSATTYLLGIFERLPAILLHISLSVLVWIAVVKGKKLLFPLAIFLHALVDAFIVMLNGYTKNLPLVEAFLVVICILIAFFTFKIWKTNQMDLIRPEKEEGEQQS